MPPQVMKAFDYGQFGVQLFFVLSGWLIFSLYWGDRPFTQAVYWSRRWARIWPLWVIFLAVSYLAYGVPDTGYPWVLAFVLGAVFLGWLSPLLVAIPLGGLTIQQEMGHYLLFSLFRRRSGLFLAGTVVVGYLSMIGARGLLVIVGHDSAAGWALDAWLRLSLFNSWPFFLVGGAGFITFRRWQRGGVTDLFPQRSWTTVAILVALVLSMLTTYSEAEIPGYFVLGYVVLLVGIALAGNALPVIGAGLQSIGRYSYFMYFFHFWVLRWFEQGYRDRGLPSGETSMLYNIALLTGVVVVTTAVSWGVGVISWNVLEKRVLAVAHRRVPTPRSTPAASA
jgi:peptidoglycan/LPS O-acetylase OafA/YrhL